MNTSFFWTAWKKIVLAYAVGVGLGILIGTVLVHVANIAPHTVYEVSAKRLSFALPVFTSGAQAGIDTGLLLFAWNTLGALATMSFIHTAAWFNPKQMGASPKAIRKFFCSKRPMKLLCFLPGCRRIPEESVRRVFVWLMVPLIGMVLLGMESGLSIATSRGIFGSYFIGIISLLPHGIIEIPTFALAGAVAYSAHLRIREDTAFAHSEPVFKTLSAYRTTIPLRKIALIVIIGLLVAGVVEGHVTGALLNHFLGQSA
jgi:hypothetical protein